MSSILWIPCYMEGDQDVEYRCLKSGDIIRTTQHTLYETLSTLKPKIKSGIFNEIVITDDGSTDNTLEGVSRFLCETGLPRNKLKIVGSAIRMGKMARFFEIMDMYGSSGAEILTMTDADMVGLGGDTFDLLSRPETGFSGTMLVSHQAEYFSEVRTYKTFGHKSSGTRSVVFPRAQAIFKREGFNIGNFPGTGYGLELFLNSFLMEGGVYVNHEGSSQIPHFLEPERKGLCLSLDIRKTEHAMNLRNPLILKNGRLNLSKIVNGLRVDMDFGDGATKSIDLDISADDFSCRKTYYDLKDSANFILTSIFQDRGRENFWDDEEEQKLVDYLYSFYIVHDEPITIQ